jgi:hypothetical protein
MGSWAVNENAGRTPQVRDYVYICDNAYTREQILEMEKLILAKLEFRLSLPTVWSWMRRFTKAAGRETDPAFFNLVSYVIDLRSAPHTKPDRVCVLHLAGVDQPEDMPHPCTKSEKMQHSL